MLPYDMGKQVDRSDWAKGPWDNEPDVLEWSDEVTGLDCAILRMPWNGALNGYVAVPEGHPLHGKGYSDRVKVPEGAMERSVNITQDIGHIRLFTASIGISDDKQEAALDLLLFCHGGLTYAKSSTDGSWWFGFDAQHCDDAEPKGGRAWATDAVYRDMPYMKAQCERLAWQIKLLSEGGTFGNT